MSSAVDTERTWIERASPLQIADWDAQVQRLSGATPFHGQGWAAALQDTYAFTPLYLVARRGSGICGTLPLMEAASWVTGRRGIALPFSDTCAPLATSPEIREALVEAALTLGRERHWRYCEFRSDAVAGAPASTRYLGHSLDLTPGATALLQRTDSAVRRALRKAERSDVRVDLCHDLESVRAFHGLVCVTRRRQGLPPQPLRFFENIHRHLLARGAGVLVLARLHDRPIAGALFLHSGPTALFKFGASDEQFQQFRPNNLVMWRAIEWHASSGFHQLDFGRTDLTHDGLRRFKLGWGALESEIRYVRHDYRTRRFVPEPSHPGSSGSMIFRFLPIPVSRAVGALLYRHAA